MKLFALVLASVSEWHFANADTCPDAPDHHVECDAKAPYRTFSGQCNNLGHQDWGMEATTQRRLLPPIYERDDAGIKVAPIGWNAGQRYGRKPIPTVREVSNGVANIKNEGQVQYIKELTDHVGAFGQLMAHTLIHVPDDASLGRPGAAACATCDNTPACFPIQLPAGDPFRSRSSKPGPGKDCMVFARSNSFCPNRPFTDMKDPGRGPVNDRSSFIDASVVYGHHDKWSSFVRNGTSAFLKVNTVVADEGGRPFLPTTDQIFGPPVKPCMNEAGVAGSAGCFLPGDGRAVTPALGVQHTIWMRYHNYLAGQLQAMNGHWDEEKVFQEARKIVVGLHQKIFFYDLLPLIVGQNVMEKVVGEYKGYNANVNPSVSNGFSQAWRFGHAMVRTEVFVLDENYNEHPSYPKYDLSAGYLRPWRLTNYGGVDATLRGMIFKETKKIAPGAIMSDMLRNDAFKGTKPGNENGHDVASMNMQRGRDHGVPLYGAWKRMCEKLVTKNTNMVYKANSFFIKDRKAVKQLKKLYGSVDNADLFIAGLLEKLVKGGAVGPTFRCIIIEQLVRTRTGDRFWYEHKKQHSPEQVNAINSQSLGNVICTDTITGLKKLPPNVFKTSSKSELISCSARPSIDLSAWRDDAGQVTASMFGTTENPADATGRVTLGGATTEPMTTTFGSATTTG